MSNLPASPLRKNLLSSLGLLLLAALPVCACAQAPAQDAGKITALVPVDHVLRAQQTLTAAKEMPVFWGDVVSTQRGGRVRIDLHDGSTLNVGSESSLVIQQHDPAAQSTWLELAVGKLRAKVARIAQPSGGVRVRTPVAVVGVKGTEEYIETSAALTTVIALGGGQVTVRSRDPRFPQEVVLEPGETTSVAAHQAPAPKRPATADELRRAAEETAIELLQTGAAAAKNVAGAVESAANALGLPRGTPIRAVLSSALDARKNKPGDTVQAKTAEAVKSQGRVVLPKNTKLIGHVTQAQAKTKEHAESTLGIAFDRAVVKNGQEVPIALAIQAVAAPEASASALAEEPIGPAPATMPSAPAGGASSGGGLVPNVAGAAGSAAGTVTTTAGAATRTAGGTAGATTSATGSAAGKNVSGALGASATGIIGLKDLTLNTSAGVTTGAALSSTRRNVHLDSGTRLLLRVE